MATLPNVNMSAAEVQALTTTPDDKTQTRVITKAIMDAFTTLKPADDAAADAATEAAGVRERVMGDMALLSAEQDWSADHIIDASKAAVEAWEAGKNLATPSLKQFAVELRRAMHPSARDYVVEAFEDSRELWAKSGESEDHPLRKAFAKRYHMVAGSKGVLQAHIDADMPAPKPGTPDKRIATDHGDASDPYAIAGAKQSADKADPKAAARVIAKLVKALQAIETEFPAPAIGQMISFAAALDAATLANAKNAKMAAMHRAAKAKPAPAVAGTPKAPKVSQPALDEVIEDLVSE